MKRAIRTLLRLIAAGCVVIGGMDIGLEFTRQRMHKGQISVWTCVINFLVVVIGIILFARSAAIAEKFADDFEE